MEASKIVTENVGVRLQKMSVRDQALVLCRLAEARLRSAFSTADVLDLFKEMSLPPPINVSDVIAKLGQKAFVTPSDKKRWRLTPMGRSRSSDLLSDIDLAAAQAEALISGVSMLGDVPHVFVPPTFAPPNLILPLSHFLAKYPLDTNVFGMTRFPAQEDGVSDQIRPAVEAVRRACKMHGFAFHLTSDRAIHDDLWTNVAAHMWASRYGIAFFEDSQGKGLNYNLTIEVGSMLMSGRRCALLKDRSLPKMPTDLVGQIYKDVSLDNPITVSNAIHLWLTQDIGVDRCSECPTPAIISAAA